MIQDCSEYYSMYLVFGLNIIVWEEDLKIGNLNAYHTAQTRIEYQESSSNIASLKRA